MPMPTGSQGYASYHDQFFLTGLEPPRLPGGDDPAGKARDEQPDYLIPDQPVHHGICS